MSQFPLYLKNGEVLRRQTSQLFFFLLPWKHVKRSAFQNRRLAVLRNGFSGPKSSVSGLSRNGPLAAMKVQRYRGYAAVWAIPRSHLIFFREETGISIKWVPFLPSRIADHQISVKLLVEAFLEGSKYTHVHLQSDVCIRKEILWLYLSKMTKDVEFDGCN